jgi:hypothetical protein
MSRKKLIRSKMSSIDGKKKLMNSKQLYKINTMLEGKRSKTLKN